MFGRVAVAEGASRSRSREGARVSRSGESSRVGQPSQSKSAQTQSVEAEPVLEGASTGRTFSWNIGEIAGRGERGAPGGGAEARRPVGTLPWPMQAKLEVGASSDPLEREADRVSEQVMRMPSTGAAAPALKGGAAHGVQRSCACGGTCAACRGEHAELEQGAGQQGVVQRAPAGPQISNMGSPGGSGMTAPPTVDAVLNSPGRPLDAGTRAFMEPRFGHDFGAVRVHTGGAARSSAAEVGARAYTVGRHVVLRDEAPSRGLMAHELAHVVQQDAGSTSLVQRDDKKDGASGGQAGVESRLQVIEESGAAANPRLAEIIRNGPMPPNDKTKVIAAAIIDVEGYTGPREIRALSGADTDTLGQGAAVYHATSPDARTISATRGISAPGARREFPFAHINDAEMKIFEKVLPGLPANAKGTIHFMTMRKLKGVAVPEPYAACSGCIRASFEFSGKEKGVDVVSHAPVHPAGTVDMDAHPGGDHETPIDNPRNRPPKVVQTTPKDADVDQSTGRVVPGPNTDAANAANAARKAAKPAAVHDTDVHGGGAGDSPAVKGAGPAAVHDTDAHGGSPAAKAAGPAAVHDTEIHEGGGLPASKGAVPTSHATELVSGLGMGVASVGLGWVAAKIQAKVYGDIANRQIGALLEAAKKKVNDNPDEALKKMMEFPDKQVYAWVHLVSATITTYGVDNTSPEPPTTDSAPMIQLGGVEYATGPVPPELVQGFPQFSGGGRHTIMIHSIILDLPIPQVPLETLIGYAKERGLALNSLVPYVLEHYQAAIDAAQVGLNARAAIWSALKANDDTWHKLDVLYRQAEKRKDVKTQVSLLTGMMERTKSTQELNAELPKINEIIARQNATLEHWQGILDLVKPTGP